MVPPSLIRSSIYLSLFHLLGIAFASLLKLGLTRTSLLVVVDMGQSLDCHTVVVGGMSRREKVRVLLWRVEGGGWIAA